MDFSLFAGLLVSGFMVSGVCLAAERLEEEEIPEVIVTGSFLPSETHIAVPVTFWSPEDLKASGADTDLSSFLQTLNQSGRAANALATGGASTINGGLSTVDLRGLGPNRTLVLVNGKRLVGGDPLNPTVVDLNAIPSDWIERVEVYSGGATAIYGSGAIAGVVNIITRTEYQGVNIKARYGLSDEGDGEETGLSFSAGTSFAENRGHVALNIGWDKNQPIWSRDREFSAHTERLGDRRAYSQFTPGGVILAANNQPRVANDQGLWLDTYNVLQHGYNAAEDRQLYVPLERTQAQLVASFDLSDSTSLYAQLSGGIHESSNQQEAATVLNSPNTSLPSTYPFFPQEILETWSAANLPLPPQIRYARRLNEMGPRIYEQEREHWRFLAGMETTIGSWTSDLSYQQSSSDFSQIASGHHDLQRMSWALNVEQVPGNPGQYRCASETARNLGCVPVDLFSGGGMAPAAIAFVRAEQTFDALLEMRELQWRLQGPLFALPAGPATAVVGADWRKDMIESWVDALTQVGRISSVALSPVNGSDEVREIYTEWHLPLIKDQVVDALDASLAYRLSDYDSIGSAHSWNAALSLSPWPQLNLFARKSLAIRAPSASEFYMPPTGGSLTISDPCAASSLVSEQTRENCRGLGIPDNYTPSAPELAVPYRMSGNPYLEEEKAHTTTLGLAYSPWQNSKLNVRVSWFDIDIDDAIANISPGFKLTSCYGSADFPANPLCRGLNRGAEADNFRFLSLQLGPENIASFQTRGLDTELDSRLALGPGSLQNRLLITYTDRLLREANGQLNNWINEPGSQRWKANYLLGYSQGPWQTALTARYLGSAVIENNSVEAYVRNNNNLPSATYWGAHVAYAWNLLGGGDENLRLSLNLHNLTDKQPPYVPNVPSNNRVSNLGTNTAAGVYDVRGRFWKLGLEYSF